VFPLSRGLPFKITMDGIQPNAHAGFITFFSTNRTLDLVFAGRRISNAGYCCVCFHLLAISRKSQFHSSVLDIKIGKTHDHVPYFNVYDCGFSLYEVSLHEQDCNLR
jgi:hypothetical protein